MMNLKTWTPNEYSIDNARNNRVDAVIYTDRISVDVQITRCVKKETALRRLWKTLEANNMTGGLTLIDALSMLSDTNEYHDGFYRLGAEYDPETGWYVWYCYAVESNTEEQPTENTAEDAEQSAQPAEEQTQTSTPDYKKIKCCELFTASFSDGDLMVGTLSQLYAARNGRKMTIRPVIWLYKSTNGKYIIDYIMQGYEWNLGQFDTLAEAEKASAAFNAQPAPDVAAMLTEAALKRFSCKVECKALGDDGKQYDAVWCPDYKAIFFAIPSHIKILGYIPQNKEG